MQPSLVSPCTLQASTHLAMQGKLHWTLPLLSRLTAHVKLVGPSISCEGSPLNGDFSGKWRHNPHVQSYVVATDQVSHLMACPCQASLTCLGGRRAVHNVSASESTWHIWLHAVWLRFASMAGISMAWLCKQLSMHSYDSPTQQRLLL